MECAGCRSKLMLLAHAEGVCYSRQDSRHFSRMSVRSSILATSIKWHQVARLGLRLGLRLKPRLRLDDIVCMSTSTT